MEEISDAHLSLVKTRFLHRTDAYATQWYNKERGVGYKKKVKVPCRHTPRCLFRECEEPIPLTRDDVRMHLIGQHTLGIYQLKENTVKWLCLDIDLKKNKEASLQIIQRVTLDAAKIFKTLAVPFLVETSGSKGYHIWVFFSEPVQAKFAKSLGVYVRNNVELPDEVGIEVFPKQTESDNFGNLIKLPLGYHKKTRNFCGFVNNKFEQRSDQWATLTNVVTLTQAQLIDLLVDHEIPLAEKTIYNNDVQGLPCMINIMNDGAKDGCRDEAAFKLACYLKKQGIPYEMCAASMEQWNEKNTPIMDRTHLFTKLRSAYKGSYSAFPCQQPLLDHFCVATCRFYEEKMKKRNDN